MRLFYLIVRLHRIPRILDMSTFASDPVLSQQSVLPGYVFATVMLQLVLLGPFDAASSAAIATGRSGFRVPRWSVKSAFAVSAKSIVP
eukprot:778156-Pyramimonas_sp.AAC.1